MQWIGAAAADALSGERIEIVTRRMAASRLVQASGCADVDRGRVGGAACLRRGYVGPDAGFRAWKAANQARPGLEAYAPELAELESRDHRQAAAAGQGDVAAAMTLFRVLRRRRDKVHGQTIPFLQATPPHAARAHGVVEGFIPLKYRCRYWRGSWVPQSPWATLVVKPAEDASLSALRVAELALEAGFPEGVLNVVTGYGREAGAALAGHPGVDYVTFTGSPPTGTAIQQAAAVNNRGVTMELGGKSPQIVFADADLDAAIPVLVGAIIQNGGQTCSAGSRILIERPVYEKVAEALGERFGCLVAGPHDADLDLGALISRRQKARVAAMTEAAEAAGAPVLARGTVAPDAPQGGFYFAPVLFGPVDPGAEIAQAEVFGPVLSLFPFGDETEALRLANGTDYGLVAGVWTQDGGRQHRVAKRVRAGQVFVNGYGAGGGIELPFGGFGKSGHGREKGFEALYDMSATKTIVFNHG